MTNCGSFTKGGELSGAATTRRSRGAVSRSITSIVRGGGTDGGDEVGDAVVGFQRVAQMAVGVDAVVVAAADFGALDVAALDEVGEDELDGAGGDVARQTLWLRGYVGS
ncbi:hypothetical protein [Saccharomonospora cyanea]|uniref:hypothetical protein n=1 Tax=Saccharomonospora cyanea TaxID=40989 RepID=UPI0005B77548|nr:hypothetical protein [Saccharomonospora cyanea]